MKNSTLSLYKKYLLLFFLISPAYLFAQDTTETVTSVSEKEYVKGTFENGVVINNQTIENTGGKTLQFMIQHRFGLIEDETDLFGFFAPSNIRFGLDYGITKRISIGLGATKNKSIYDLQGKVNLLDQTKGKGSPVSVAFYGDIAKSTQPDENFLNQEGEFKNINKFSYFSELMIARKFNSKISLQVAGTFSHFNIIDSVYGQHDFYGVSFVGRYKFSPQSSVMVDFDYLMNVSGIDESVRPKPNLSLGYEVSTGSHQFQVFICTGQGIINQEYRVFNQNDFTDLDFLFGFNITRLWGFK